MSELRRTVEGVLGMKFEERYSDYLGGDYYRWHGSDREGSIIVANFGDHEEIYRQEFSDYSVLLEINEPVNPEVVEDGLRNIADLDLLETKIN
jgi:hypothetical protein